MLKLLAFDLPDADVEITIGDTFVSKGGGVRFLRKLLVALNIYLPPAWVVLVSEVRPNHDQLKSETIPEGK